MVEIEMTKEDKDFYALFEGRVPKFEDIPDDEGDRELKRIIAKIPDFTEESLEAERRHAEEKATEWHKWIEENLGPIEIEEEKIVNEDDIDPFEGQVILTKDGYKRWEYVVNENWTSQADYADFKWVECE